jgi:3-phenylpropionate/trans-cinnamate dioxygenase ferredoxin subunit
VWTEGNNSARFPWSAALQLAALDGGRATDRPLRSFVVAGGRGLRPGDQLGATVFFFLRECEGAFMADVTIEIIKNGPYIVKGEVEMKDADGNSYPAEKRMALCRCGASTEKPFCDGTHSKIGFQAAEKAVSESAEER